MGKKKKIDRERPRQNTYYKRKRTLLSKAYELSVMCNVDICLIIIDNIQHHLDILDSNKTLVKMLNLNEYIKQLKKTMKDNYYHYYSNQEYEQFLNQTSKTNQSKVLKQKIDNERVRQNTYYKRKTVVLSKAYELSVICDVDIFLVIVDNTQHHLDILDSNKALFSMLDSNAYILHLKKTMKNKDYHYYSNQEYEQLLNHTSKTNQDIISTEYESIEVSKKSSLINNENANIRNTTDTNELIKSLSPNNFFSIDWDLKFFTEILLSSKSPSLDNNFVINKTVNTSENNDKAKNKKKKKDGETLFNMIKESNIKLIVQDLPDYSNSNNSQSSNNNILNNSYISPLGFKNDMFINLPDKMNLININNPVYRMNNMFNNTRQTSFHLNTPEEPEYLFKRFRSPYENILTKSINMIISRDFDYKGGFISTSVDNNIPDILNLLSNNSMNWNQQSK